MNQNKSEKVDLPQQIDTSFNSDMQRVKTAASVGLSLTVILVGQLVSNFFIATSMKEILTSIRMLQIVSFFIYFEISFTPVSKLFLKTINDFAMFKLIPDEQMEKILIWFGFQDENEPVTLKKLRMLAAK